MGMRQKAEASHTRLYWFLSLVAERPPKVAVGFNPRSAIPPNHLVAERRWNHRDTLGRPRDVCRRLHTSPRRRVETHGGRYAGGSSLAKLLATHRGSIERVS